jgi:transposase
MVFREGVHPFDQYIYCPTSQGHVKELVVPGSGRFSLDTQVLGPLPLVNHFLERLRLPELLERHVPHHDRRLRLAPSLALGVLVRNLVLHREPVYALGEWAAPFDARMLGLDAGEVTLLNDDRVGRALDRLFDADRATLLTELILGAVSEFAVDLSQLHNDSTSISFSGRYAGATGRVRGGRRTAAITFGYNKDHRPDLRQLVWILTVSADGAVPIAHRVADGNTSDDTTHIRTWDELVALAGRPDFLYVADCKLCTRSAMDHIARRGGRFLTVLPRTRREDGWYRRWMRTHPPAWVEVSRRPGRRIGDPDEVWWTAPSPSPSGEGYRIVWVKSSAKVEHDQAARTARIEAGLAALSALETRLRGSRCRFHDMIAVEEAAAAVIRDAGAERWLAVTVTAVMEKSYRQEHRGSPGASTRFRQTARRRFRLRWVVREAAVAADAASDGCFPLITNDTSLSDGELLAAYKYQPKLETRHAQLKGVQLVTPVFLKEAARIEALLCCHFISLLVHALIEREIRAGMVTKKAAELPLYPEDRGCRAPTAARVLEVFAGVARHHLRRGRTTVQVFEPTLTPLQLQVLRLLRIPPSVYASTP